MNHRPQHEIVAPDASPEEAAAVVAALEQFMRDHAVVVLDGPPTESAWKRAALDEGVRREPVSTPFWS